MLDSDESAPWYHTELTRNKAEEMLVQAEKNGAFIVRTSESIKSAFVLSEYYNNRVHHYRILPSETGYFIECPGTTLLHYFKSLTELIDYYGKPKRGLVCELTYAVEQEDDDEDENRIISFEAHSKYFNALSTRIPHEKQNAEFEKQFREYFTKQLITDSCNMLNNRNKPELLYCLFEKDISSLYKSIEIFNKRLEYAKHLFTMAMGSPIDQSLSNNQANFYTMDFPSVLTIMKNTMELISQTELLSRKLFTQFNNEPRSEDTYQIYKDNLNHNNSCANMTDVGDENFEVQVGIKMIKAVIEIHPYEGKLILIKNNQHEDISCVDLTRIVKNTRNPQMLSLLRNSGENIRFIFPNLNLRERFCEITRLMVNLHNYKLSKSTLSLFTGTWNMGEATPPDSLETWLTNKGTGIKLKGFNDTVHDLYLIGVQENDSLMRIPFSDWPTKMRNHISNLNKIEYKIIAFEHFWHIGLVAIIKSELYHKIGNIQQANVKTGLGKINVGAIVGNKGAVGVSFSYENTSFLFINCHLTSGHEQKRLEKRRANYRDIMKNLIFKSSFPHCDITNQFHYIFFFGDLNYRIDLEPEIILEKIPEGDFYYLQRHDQLTIEIERNNAFFAFEEAPIRFPPTYRYIRGSRDSYHILKKKAVKDRINVPSYCDRILFKSYLNSPLLVTSYGCTDEIFTSDHSPVFATFELGIQTQYISRIPSPNLAISGPSISIVFESVEAHITRSNPNENYYFQLFSHCFEGVRKSKQCSSITEVSGGSNNVVAKWAPFEFPEPIFPLIHEKEYLIQQIVFIQVKCLGGDDDTFGEAQLSLSDYFVNSLHFQKTLTYQSYPVGSIKGLMNISDTSRRIDRIHGIQHDAYARLEIMQSLEHETFENVELSNFSPGKVSSMVTSTHHNFSKANASDLFPMIINETIESLQNTDLQKFLNKYGLGKYYDTLLRAGFKDTVQLYFLDEKYLSSMGITGDDGQKLFSLAHYISQYFWKVK